MGDKDKKEASKGRNRKGEREGLRSGRTDEVTDPPTIQKFFDRQSKSRQSSPRTPAILAHRAWAEVTQTVEPISTSALPGENVHAGQFAEHEAQSEGDTPTKLAKETGDELRQTPKSKALNKEMIEKTSRTPRSGSDHEMEVRLLAALDKLGADIGQKIETMKSEVKFEVVELKKQLAELTVRCKENTDNITSIGESLEMAHSTANQALSEQTGLAHKVQKLQEDLQNRSAEIAKLGSKINDLERRSREFNFRIIGLKQEKNEDCSKKVAQLLKGSGWAEGSVEKILESIEVAHRTGKKSPRQMIVRCATRTFRNHVVRAAKQHRRDDNVALFEDMTQQDFLARKEALPKMKEHYEKGYHVRFVRGKMQLGGKREHTTPQRNVSEMAGAQPQLQESEIEADIEGGHEP